jgi:hypothetical protein
MKGKALGRRFLTRGLDTVGPYGIDESGLQWHTGVRGPEPSQSIQKADPFHANLLLFG